MTRPPSPALPQLALLGVALAACGPVGPPSICAVAPDELVLFPDAAGGVPPNAVVRLLTGGAADDLHLVVAEHGATVSEPGDEVLVATSYGDVLEFTPRLTLLADQDYDVDVVDDTGAVVASTGFTTARWPEAGPAIDTPDAATLTPIAGDERACCASSGCRDGTVVSLPPLASDNFAPQLLLIQVDELYNDACGATSRPVGVIPVVWDGRTDLGLEAETDLRLTGCYELTVITQTLRESTPGGVVCAPGASFVPLAATPDCQPASGCNCESATTPTDILVSLAFSAAIAAFLLHRKRRLRRGEVTR